VPDQVVAETTEEQSKADAERIFARIDAAIAYAEQQSARAALSCSVMAPVLIGRRAI
jgi:hypothetical protein